MSRGSRGGLEGSSQQTSPFLRRVVGRFPQRFEGWVIEGNVHASALTRSASKAAAVVLRVFHFRVSAGPGRWGRATFILPVKACTCAVR
eukprot:579993-Prorocentrum_minimum.AAC.1